MALVDTRHLLILEDDNCLFREEVKAEPSTKKGWETFCRVDGLRELTQHTDVPHGTF